MSGFLGLQDFYSSGSGQDVDVVVFRDAGGAAIYLAGTAAGTVGSEDDAVVGKSTGG